MAERHLLNRNIKNIDPPLHYKTNYINWDNDFKPFIVNILKSRLKLNDEYIDLLTTNECINEFKKVFTHESYNENNYEFYEILGDATADKIVVWYANEKFPELENIKAKGIMGGEAIMTRLKQMVVAKAAFSSFSKELGFWDFVRIKDDEFIIKRSAISEDVFEAFIGCLEKLTNNKIGIFSGYGMCWFFMIPFLKKFMDDIDITNYDELYDSKTRLNNLFGEFGTRKIDNRQIKNVNGVFINTQNNNGVFNPQLQIIVQWKKDNNGVFKTYRLGLEDENRFTSLSDAEKKLSSIALNDNVGEEIKKIYYKEFQTIINDRAEKKRLNDEKKKVRI